MDRTGPRIIGTLLDYAALDVQTLSVDESIGHDLSGGREHPAERGP